MTTPTDTQRAEFEARLAAMPEWAPEFVVHRPWVEKLLLNAWQAATERERERAGKVCERMNDSDYSPAQCAAAIREVGT